SSHCNMCEVDFVADFSSRVEVTFSLHPEIENINLPAFCIPPKNMEVFAGLNLPPGEKAEADLELVPGKYGYFCPITVTKGVLTVEGDVTDAVQEMTIHQLEESRYDHPFYRLRPGKIHLKAINDTNSLSGVFLTKNELSEELSPDDFGLRLSGLELTHFPVFRELFGSETLSERERMTISGVTILFTDIKGSTKMYEDLGDIPAYNIVRDHFDILIDVIKNNGGYVIKTIGDAVMASFMRSDDSIKSVYEVFEEFDKYNESKGSNEKVSLKIGVHSGPAILVNLNDRIDYFGTTVNKAARIQSLSNSENFCVSEEIFGQPEIKELLKQNGVKRVNRKFRELKGLSGKHPVYFIPIGK
ncbi:MAG: adenylate/guanylate cyclase domain-containing protein, partial [Leptospiraceae bacterium]|nr:adenylate/guanylate cyclase domain-containing protein [Leptospiraceae bacterium]